jgi:hypothetical protein
MYDALLHFLLKLCPRLRLILVQTTFFVFFAAAAVALVVSAYF